MHHVKKTLGVTLLHPSKNFVLEIQNKNYCGQSLRCGFPEKKSHTRCSEITGFFKLSWTKIYIFWANVPYHLPRNPKVPTTIPRITIGKSQEYISTMYLECASHTTHSEVPKVQKSMTCKILTQYYVDQYPVAHRPWRSSGLPLVSGMLAGPDKAHPWTVPTCGDDQSHCLPTVPDALPDIHS